MDDLKRVWQQQKDAEKVEKTEKSESEHDLHAESKLDGVPKALPALAQATAYQKKAAKVGFDWATIEPVIDKVLEEFEEIKTAASDAERASEFGDLLFAVVNWARWHDIDAETALRETNGRFRARFGYIEEQARVAGRDLPDMSLDEMDALWDEAKANGH